MAPAWLIRALSGGRFRRLLHVPDDCLFVRVGTYRYRVSTAVHLLSVRAFRTSWHPVVEIHFLSLTRYGSTRSGARLYSSDWTPAVAWDAIRDLCERLRGPLVFCKCDPFLVPGQPGLFRVDLTGTLASAAGPVVVRRLADDVFVARGPSPLSPHWQVLGGAESTFSAGSFEAHVAVRADSRPCESERVRISLRYDALTWYLSFSRVQLCLGGGLDVYLSIDDVVDGRALPGRLPRLNKYDHYIDSGDSGVRPSKYVHVGILGDYVTLCGGVSVRRRVQEGRWRSDEDVLRAVCGRQFLRATLSASRIQSAWRRAISNPSHALCRRRLLAEFESLR